jgi:hypothetical protein
MNHLHHNKLINLVPMLQNIFLLPLWPSHKISCRLFRLDRFDTLDKIVYNCEMVQLLKL